MTHARSDSSAWTLTPAAYGRATRIYRNYSEANRFIAAAAVAVTLGGAWWGCVLLGGANTPGPHLFYLPIVLAAVRFAWPVAIATSVAAGVLAGPALPAYVSAGIPQQPSAWLFRLGMFVTISLFITVLVRDPHAASRSRLQDAILSARLLRALDSGAVEVFYQPIYRLPGEELEGVEALVRWRQAPDRYANPGRFIPAAERTGAITRVDEYVLREAAATIHAWAAGGRPVWASVNLSATTVCHPRIVDCVRDVLDTVGLPAQFLQLEITESALVKDLPTAVGHIAALRALGVKVAIDDFGSGHASLNYLQRLPADVVKLDQSLVTAAATDDRSNRLLLGAVHLCGLLDLQVVGEGVENSDQLARLESAGVQMVQGFLLCRPAPADHIRELLDSATR